MRATDLRATQSLLARLRLGRLTISLILLLAAVLGVLGVSILAYRASAQSGKVPSSTFPLYPIAGRMAPNFVLRNQFNQTKTLRQYRGRELVLAFVDDQCTTVCPLTAEQLQFARSRLGNERFKVALVAINANPVATSVGDVRRWSQEHGMLHQWDFLTGSTVQLNRMYHAYHVFDSVARDGSVTHDAGIFVIDDRGRERDFSETVQPHSGSLVRDQEDAIYLAMRRWLP